jgi:hypothetical protein
MVFALFADFIRHWITRIHQNAATTIAYFVICSSQIFHSKIFGYFVAVEMCQQNTQNHCRIQVVAARIAQSFDSEWPRNACSNCLNLEVIWAILLLHIGGNKIAKPIQICSILIAI